MAPSSRDRISVDLHGLKAALMERAQALGVSPSELVRKALADELGRSAGKVIDPSEKRRGGRIGERARLCLRMGRDEAAATLACTRAGAPPRSRRSNGAKMATTRVAQKAAASDVAPNSPTKRSVGTMTLVTPCSAATAPPRSSERASPTDV